MLSHRFEQTKNVYSDFLLVMISTVFLTSIIGCQKATTSNKIATTLTTKTPPPVTTTSKPPASSGNSTSPPVTAVVSTLTNITPTETPTSPPLVRVSVGDYEQQYVQAATLLNSTKTSGKFNYWMVTVIEAGFFITSSSGNSIYYLRIDMEVTFKTGEAITGYFSALGSIAIISPQTQYQFDPADSTLILQDRTFNWDSPVDGYWVFQVQGNPDPLNTVQLSFTGGNDSGTHWSFQL